MPKQSTMKHDRHVSTIGELIAAHMARTGHSYRDLARACDYRITHQRLSDFVKGTFTEFARPETMRILAETIGVDITDVVLGFAAALELPIRPPGAPIPLPAGAERLDEGQRRLIFDIAQNYLGTAPVAPMQDVEAIIAANEPGVVERNVKRSRRGDAAS